MVQSCSTRSTRRVTLALLIGLEVTLSAAAGQQSPWGEDRFVERSLFGNTDQAFGDLDGDGVQDLITIGSVRWVISWKRGLGDGTFGPSREIEFCASCGGLELNSLATGDMDGDGDTDIVATGEFSGLFLYANEGAGAFVRQSLPSIATGVTDCAAVDLDLDGDLDVLSRVAGILTWTENLGPGGFAPGAALASGLHAAVEYVVFDVDVDGDQDVVARTPGEILWIQQAAPGAFFDAQPLVSLGAAPVAFAALDVEGDGDNDLATVQSDWSVTWHPNDGAGGFGPGQVIVSGQNSQPISVAAGDIDGDGDSDLVVGESFGGGVVLYESLAGSFLTPGTSVVTTSAGSYLELLDLDGDGRLDIAFDSADAGPPETLRTALALGPVSFSDPMVVAASTIGLFGFAAADLNGDGALDLAAARPGSGELVALWGTGNGQFTGPSVLAVGLSGIEAAVSGDVDGDGDTDLVVGILTPTLNEAEVLVFRNDGLGQFGVPLPVWTASAAATPTVQVSSRGAGVDLLVTYVEPGAPASLTAQWLVNDGGGGFSSAGATSLANSELPKIVDVDLDGSEDLVLVRSSGQPRLFWHRTVGGVIGNAQPIDTSGRIPQLVLPSDFNQDGRDDLVVLFFSPGIDLFPGVPGAGFGAPETLYPLSLLELESSAIVIDADLDGDLDLVYGNGGQSADVFYLRNVGGQLVDLIRLDSPWRFQATVRFEDLFSADMDGDLDPELLRGSSIGLSIQLGSSRAGSGYCFQVVPNSGGDFGRISASGSDAVSVNDLTLQASALPPGRFGYFLVADEPGFSPGPSGSAGALCVGGAIGRLIGSPGDVFVTSAAGTASVMLDLARVPTPNGFEALMAGETRYFQGWVRDVQAGFTSSFTNGLRVTFGP